jgi:hypothetical protein
MDANKMNATNCELNNKSDKSLSSNQICLVRTRVVPRKTQQDKERNCLYVDIDKAVEILKKNDTYYECLFDNTMTKLYLDIERDDYEQQPNNETLNSIKEACLNEICRIKNGVEDFDVEKHVLIAQRHRWIEKRGKKTFQVSFRFWITNIAIPYTHIPYLLKELGCDNQNVPVIDTKFDMSCYNKGNQIMNAVWNCKEDDLGHPLTPITDHDEKCFISQYLSGDEHNVDMTSTIEKHEKKLVETRTRNTNMNINEDDYNNARTLIGMLSPKRAENYDTWIRVGTLCWQ